jgi:hypothetical protein
VFGASGAFPRVNNSERIESFILSRASDVESPACRQAPGYAQLWYNNMWNDCDFLSLNMYYNNMKSLQKLGSFQKFTASYFKIGTVSIKENPVDENVLTLYPNPVSNILHIETYNHCIVPEVKIYSILGVLLIHTKGYQIDVSSLASGMYIVEIDGVCRKIVKQ